MSSKKLFSKLTTDTEKKEKLIAYAKWLADELGRPLTRNDFRIKGRISTIPIIRLFGSLYDFYSVCEFKKPRKPGMLDDDFKRFIFSIKTTTKTGCWETDYYATSSLDGVITLSYRGKTRQLPKLIYELYNQKVKTGFIVMHKCDNRACFNPKHLSIGTSSDNTIDCLKKNRRPKKYKSRRPSNKISDPYAYEEIIAYVKKNIIISKRNEWLFKHQCSTSGYPQIYIKGKTYYLHKLILANKLDKKYEEIEVARHILSNGAKPNRNDVNPEHLIEGSQTDNLMDTRKYSKTFKLSAKKASEIKNVAANTDFSERGSKSQFDKKYAQKYNISESAVSSIRRDKAWNI